MKYVSQVQVCLFRRGVVSRLCGCDECFSRQPRVTRIDTRASYSTIAPKPKKFAEPFSATGSAASWSTFR
jgi:hypothetical protein